MPLNVSPGKERVINGFTFRSILGKGAYGEVYLASKQGSQFAVKVMRRPPPTYTHPMMAARSGGTKTSSNAASTIKQEVAMMKRANERRDLDSAAMQGQLDALTKLVRERLQPRHGND